MSTMSAAPVNDSPVEVGKDDGQCDDAEVMNEDDQKDDKGGDSTNATNEETGTENISPDRGERDSTPGGNGPAEAKEINQDNKANVAIQANDYEIERNSGYLPARRRIIPFKFRDFHDPDNIPEDNNDEDYLPGEGVLRRMRRNVAKQPGRPPGKGPGRLKKNRRDHAYDRNDPDQVPGENEGDAVQDSGDGTENKEADMGVTLGKRPRGRPSKDSPWGGNALPKIFKCLSCDKSFSQKGNLKVHMRTHTKERPFKCDVDSCGKTFRSKESLKRHKLAHMGIKMFECDICKKRFTSHVALKEHVSRHTDSRPYKCDHCDRWFRQRSCLKRHLTTHSSDQPYGCDICGRRFSMTVYLKSHMRMHTGEKPFECKTCSKSFAHQSDLARHQNVHSGVKPYPCEVCGARFSDPSSRRRHVKEHMGYKPYVCQLCGVVAFKRSGQLKAHLHKKHFKDDVVISKQGLYNSLQFDFKRGSQFPATFDQSLSLDGSMISLVTPESQTLLLQQAAGDQTVQLQETQLQPLQATDQEITIQIHPDSVEGISNGEAQPVISGQVLGADDANQLLQTGQIVLAETTVDSETQGGENLVAQELILASDPDGGTPGTEEQQILEETQHIIQQIQSQLEETGSHAGVIQIIHDDESQQIVEIQYQSLKNPVEEKSGKEDEEDSMEQTQDFQQIQEDQEQKGECDANLEVESSHHDESSQDDASHEKIPSDTQDTDLIENAPSERPQNAEPMPGQFIHDVTPASNDDFVINPDFDSQEYYNWLSNFTELCKLVPMPLDVDLFQKISQVHKTLTDVLANPSGILTNKENFRILMNISNELNGISNEHLTYVLQNLDQSDPSETH